ncbi:Uncharacterised protein [Mycobacteroides abscessus subsp. abscessus]|nr:Uncharacterised protein [Mycobacteroides abscessus subsp. abscessus]
MWFSVVLLAVTAFARLSIWRPPPHRRPPNLGASRSLTIATFLLAAGFAAQAHPFDTWIDTTLGDPVGADHVSDLAHTLTIMAACGLLGLIPLRDPRRERWRRPWGVLVVVLMAVAVVASRLGAVAITANESYQNSLAVVVVASCVLIVVSTVRRLRGARLLAAMTFAALAALGSAGLTVYTLIAAPTFMQDHYDQMLTVTSVPVAVGVSAAGLYGLWLGWRRS